MIAPADRMSVIAEWRPTQAPQYLKRKEYMLNWLDKLEVMLADGSQALNEQRADLHRLRKIILRENPAYTTGPSVDPIIADLSQQRGVGHKRTSAETPMPEDQLVSLFSGADIPQLPVDSLIRMPRAPAMPGREPAPDVIGPGSMLILSSIECPTKMGSTTLLFSVALIVEDVPSGGADELPVSWFVPCYSPEASMKVGKKKEVVDIFGKWTNYEDLSIEEARNVELSPVLIEINADQRMPCSID